jgi:hypothetical protein
MSNYVATRANWISGLFPAPATASVASGPVSPGTAVTLSGTGPIYYTTNGVDPRASGGGLAAGVQLYTSPITINQTTVLTIRRQVAGDLAIPRSHLHHVESAHHPCVPRERGLCRSRRYRR